MVVGIVVGFEYYVGTRVMLLSSEAMMAIYVTKQLADCRNEYFFSKLHVKIPSLANVKSCVTIGPIY